MSHLEIKICGLTNAVDARAALESGADFLGFVFHAASPRGTQATAAARILDALPGHVRAVGVFVNADRRTIEATVRDCRLCAVQLHGEESPEAFRDLAPALWRAVWWREGRWWPDPAHWTHAERFVVDGGAPAQRGGSGKRADWEQAAAFARSHRVMLAGGLTPANVAAAVAQVRPLGVDVASGVEQAPGRKDPAAMRAFVSNARQAVLVSRSCHE